MSAYFFRTTLKLTSPILIFPIFSIDIHIIICLYEYTMIKELDEDMLCDLAELFKIFGDSTRIKILYALLDKELSVTEIAEELNMTQPAISQQLRVLKTNGLVSFKRDGKSLIYSLADEHVRIILNIGVEHLGDR